LMRTKTNASMSQGQGWTWQPKN